MNVLNKHLVPNEKLCMSLAKPILSCKFMIAFSNSNMSIHNSWMPLAKTITSLNENPCIYIYIYSNTLIFKEGPCTYLVRPTLPFKVYLCHGRKQILWWKQVDVFRLHKILALATKENVLLWSKRLQWGFDELLLWAIRMISKELIRFGPWQPPEKFLSSFNEFW